MPDPTDTIRTTRPARPSRRVRPPAPPLDLVARAGLELAPGPVEQYLRSTAEVGDRMKQIEVQRRAEQLIQDGLGRGAADRIAAQRHNVGERTARRYRLGK
jgi:hypothetical protein